MTTEQAASRKRAKIITQLCWEIGKTELGKNLTTQETITLAISLIHRKR